MKASKNDACTALTRLYTLLATALSHRPEELVVGTMAENGVITLLTEVSSQDYGIIVGKHGSMRTRLDNILFAAASRIGWKSKLIVAANGDRQEITTQFRHDANWDKDRVLIAFTAIWRALAGDATVEIKDFGANMTTFTAVVRGELPPPQVQNWISELFDAVGKSRGRLIAASARKEMNRQ